MNELPLIIQDFFQARLCLPAFSPKNPIFNKSSLKFIITDEGRLVLKAGGCFDNEYFIEDHLPGGGQALENTRLTVQDSSGFAVIKQIVAKRRSRF
jgi:hypothetical protein